MAGDMRALTPRGKDRVAERAAKRTEGERFERAAIIAGEAESQMTRSDLGDLLHPVAGNNKVRLGIT
jgi:hypothetical protein